MARNEVSCCVCRPCANTHTTHTRVLLESAIHIPHKQRHIPTWAQHLVLPSVDLVADVDCCCAHVDCCCACVDCQVFVPCVAAAVFVVAADFVVVVVVVVVAGMVSVYYVAPGIPSWIV